MLKRRHDRVTYIQRISVTNFANRHEWDTVVHSRW